VASLKFNFKIQQYQTDAVASVVNCFKGQPYQDNVSYRRNIGSKLKGQVDSQMSFIFDGEQSKQLFRRMLMSPALRMRNC
jgi:type III restriction enzyme